MRCVTVPQVAHTLQDALDRWSEVAAGLAEISDAMNLGGLDAEAQAFDPARCHSPLPRAYQWADGSAYVNHVALVRPARGAEMPASFWSAPLIYQRGRVSFPDTFRDTHTVNAAHGLELEPPTTATP